MASKIFLVSCVLAVFVQVAVGQCIGRAYDGLATPLDVTGRWAFDGVIGDGLWGRGCGGPGIGITATSGGGLPVASASAIPPVGVAVASENMYEGILAAVGELPFVGTVGVEGVLPTVGAGAVNYGCGNGATAMVSDVAPGIAGPYGAYGATGVAGPLTGFGTAAIGPGVGAPGIGYRGWTGRGCAI